MIKDKSLLLLVILSLLLLVFITVLPFPLIWSVNVLLGLGIQYGFQQWLATWIVMLFTGMCKIQFKK